MPGGEGNAFSSIWHQPESNQDPVLKTMTQRLKATEARLLQINRSRAIPPISHTVRDRHVSIESLLLWRCDHIDGCRVGFSVFDGVLVNCDDASVICSDKERLAELRTVLYRSPDESVLGVVER